MIHRIAPDVVHAANAISVALGSDEPHRGVRPERGGGGRCRSTGGTQVRFTRTLPTILALETCIFPGSVLLPTGTAEWLHRMSMQQANGPNLKEENTP